MDNQTLSENGPAAEPTNNPLSAPSADRSVGGTVIQSAVPAEQPPAPITLADPSNPFPSSPQSSSLPQSVIEQQQYRTGQWPARPRIASVGTIYYQQPGQQPQSLSINHHRWLSADEQPYTRRMKMLEGETKSLDVGWLEEIGVSLVVIENREGYGMQVTPSEEEREDIKKRIVVLSAKGCPVLRVRPGETVAFEPVDVKELTLHCTHKNAIIVITAFPN